MSIGCSSSELGAVRAEAGDFDDRIRLIQSKDKLPTRCVPHLRPAVRPASDKLSTIRAKANGQDWTNMGISDEQYSIAADGIPQVSGAVVTYRYNRAAIGTERYGRANFDLYNGPQY